MNNPLNYKDSTGHKSKAVNETSWKAVGVTSGAVGKMMGKAITKAMNQATTTITKAQKNGSARERGTSASTVNKTGDRKFESISNANEESGLGEGYSSF